MKNSNSSLKRHIGLLSLTLYGVGDILGAGIYGLIGKTAGVMGNGIWLAFLVSMVTAGLTGLSYASIGSRYPKAAGASYAVLKGFESPFLAYMVGLCLLASGITSMATAARVFSHHLQGLGLQLPLQVLIILFSLVLAFIVFRGIRESIWANSICTTIELSGLALIIFVGFKYLGQVSYMDFTTPDRPSGNLPFTVLLSGAVLTFYSFVGFEDILNVSEEVKTPQKTLPQALIAAIGISSLIYITISLIAVSVIPSGDLAQSSQPLVDVVKKAAPWFPTSVYSLIAMFAVANTGLLNFIMASRLLYGMSQHGLLPKTLSAIHKKNQTPTISIFFVTLILLLFSLMGEVQSLAKSTSLLLLICFVLVNLALLKLKRKEKIPGAFNVPDAVPLLGALFCFFMISQAQAPELMFTGGILIFIGFMYLILKPKDVIFDEA